MLGMAAKSSKPSKKAAARRRAAPSKREIWEMPAPDGSPRHHLSGAQKSSAKARAQRAGRRYPNLVDNIRAAKKKPQPTPGHAKKGGHTSAKPLKDSRGGLTAAGRAWFGRKRGAHLKPQVNKERRHMTPDDMQRPAAARRIASKGRRLLEDFRKTKSQGSPRKSKSATTSRRRAGEVRPRRSRAGTHTGMRRKRTGLRRMRVGVRRLRTGVHRKRTSVARSAVRSRKR